MSNDALKPKMMYYFKIKLSSRIRRAYRTLHLNEVLNKNPKHLHIYLDGGHHVMSCESSAILFYRKYTLVRISYCSRVEYFLEIMNEFLAMSVTINCTSSPESHYIWLLYYQLCMILYLTAKYMTIHPSDLVSLN